LLSPFPILQFILCITKYYCSKCGKWKNESEFSKGKDICKDCWNKYQRERYEKWRKTHPIKEPQKQSPGEMFYCPRCGNVKKSDDFYYNKTGERTFRIELSNDRWMKGLNI